MLTRKLAIVIISLVIACDTDGQIITTIAGNGIHGYSGDGGLAVDAQLGDLYQVSVAVDSHGNIYIPMAGENVIRKVDASGIITTIAGTGALGYTGDGGPALSARLYHPSSVIIDQQDNVIFADQNGGVLRKISSSGVINSISSYGSYISSGDGGLLTQASFLAISGMTMDTNGNIYISEQSSNTVRKVNTSGVITRVAGNGTWGFSGDGGPATSAALHQPFQPAVDLNGNFYIPDASNYRVRKVSPSGIITTIAGNGTSGFSGDNGPALNAQFDGPSSVCVDKAGNIYIADIYNNTVRKVDVFGTITTFAGNKVPGYSGDGGPAVFAKFSEVMNVDIDNNENIYIVDYYNSAIRKVNNCLAATIIHTPSKVSLCGSGNATFSTTSLNATSSRWQVNYGMGWNDLSDNSMYSGSSTSSLHITAANSALNNYLYRCVITNTCGSMYSMPDTLVITSPSTPSLSISTPTNTICAGTTTTFTATSGSGGSSPIYSWQKNGISTGTNSTLYIDDKLKTGDVLTCKLTSDGSCITTSTAESNAITVTVNPLVVPSVSITPSANNICFGTPVTFTSAIFNGRTAPSFQWLKNEVNVGTNSSSYNDNSLKDGDFVSCVMTSANACVSSPSLKSNEVVMKINALVTPAITISASKISVCSNTPVTFTTAVQNGGTAPTYQWKKNGENAGLNLDAYIDSNIMDGDVISCVITSNSNCLAVSSATSNFITMKVWANPVVTLDHSSTLCKGSSRQLDAGNFRGYIWNDGSTGRTLSINNIGTYYVTVTTSDGCLGSDTVKIHSLLNAPNNFLPFDTAICSYGSLEIAAPGGFKTYGWNTTATTTAITVSKAGVYWLDVTDGHDCKGRDSIKVLQKDCMKGLYVPTAFTPNNDNKNDKLRALLFGDIKSFDFRIYNRFGQMVFQAANPSEGWDGKINGIGQELGAYVWTCKYQLGNEPVTIEKGTTVLIR